MTSLLDGTPIDLDRVQTTLDGSRWLWNFEHTDTGQPLMLRLDSSGQGALPLSEVYGQYGPLTAERQPTPAALYRQILEAAS